MYLYFLGLYYGNTAKALSRFVNKSHVSVWKWIQKYKPKRVSIKRKSINEFIMDETQIKVGPHHFWLWVAIEPNHGQILQAGMSFERNMLAAERFMPFDSYIRKELSFNRRRHTVSAGMQDSEEIYHIHFSYEKSIIERAMQYTKVRTGSFDDYFLCKKNSCKQSM
jgi:transposase-like protein